MKTPEAKLNSNKIYREARKNDGKCQKCGLESRVGKVLCKPCQDAQVISTRTRRVRAAESGLCITCCQQPVEAPYSRCTACRTDRHIYATERKIEALSHYGGLCCVCCGVTEVSMLTLDHINDDGKEHREITGLGSNFYRYLKRNGYPQTPELRVLCFNCNQSRRINGGTCAHQSD